MDVYASLIQWIPSTLPVCFFDLLLCNTKLLFFEVLLVALFFSLRTQDYLHTIQLSANLQQIMLVTVYSQLSMSFSRILIFTPFNDFLNFLNVQADRQTGVGTYRKEKLRLLVKSYGYKTNNMPAKQTIDTCTCISLFSEPHKYRN